MRLNVPALVLTIFSALAVAELAVGTKFARREIVERVERERGSHEQLARELSAELKRLDSTYELHLSRLLKQAESDTGPSFVSACRNIMGVRHFTRLNIEPGPGELQIDCRWPGMASVPVPTSPGSSTFPGLVRREMAPERFRGVADSSGIWLRDPGQPALYCRQEGTMIYILSIDETEVRAAIDDWLRRWLREPFHHLASPGGQDRIIGPRKLAIAGFDNEPLNPADWVLPIPAELGTWRVGSWDGRQTLRTWHAPTLAWFTAGSIATFLAGVVVAAWVRRERRQAEQRVSFVNRVSHELRTPLTNMLLHLDAATAYLDDREAAHRLGTVREEAQRLSRLIENVLTFSKRERAESNPLSFACDPAAVLQAVMVQFAPSFDRRGVSIHLDIGEARRGLLDGDALAQIIANLLSNIEKYAAPGTAKISLKFSGDDLILLVSDEGPGIPAASAERVFQPFERLNSHITEGVTGTGLGLSIARDLAGQMRGSLRLVPTSKGAAFELRIPAPPVPTLDSFAA